MEQNKLTAMKTYTVLQQWGWDSPESYTMNARGHEIVNKIEKKKKKSCNTKFCEFFLNISFFSFEILETITNETIREESMGETAHSSHMHPGTRGHE